MKDPADVPDYYSILGVDARAEPETIRRAFRDQARRFHPDLTGDDAMMKVVNAAWHVLRDSERRAHYDLGRPETSRPIPAPAPPHHAGPPPGNPSGPVLTYGRYEGWSLGEVAHVDPDYLEWLRHSPGYRWLRDDVDAALASARTAASRRRY
jgi:curved DNA-binding protein CbpA